MKDRQVNSAVINRSLTDIRLFRFPTKLGAYLQAFRKRQLLKIELRGLLELNDDMLRDMGISRADIKYVWRLPVSVDAAEALRECVRINQEQELLERGFRLPRRDTCRGSYFADLGSLLIN